MHKFKTHSAARTPRRRAGALTALAVLGTVLAASAPASAEPNSSTPPAKKGCTVKLEGPGAGQGIKYDHGYSFSVKNKDTGKTHTYKCNDGKWEETVAMTRPPAATRNPGSVRWADGKFEVLASGAGRYEGRSVPPGGRRYASAQQA